MAFPKAPNDTPVSVGIIEIVLRDYPAAGEPLPAPARKEFTFRLQLLNAAGEAVRSPDGDLTQFLTPLQINSLNNFLNAMRTKAVEALP